MSKHQGGTDSLHRVTLPSAISAAWWRVPSCDVGSEAPWEVATSLVGDGAEMKIEVRTKDGKTLGRTSGKVGKSQCFGHFVLPSGSEGEVYFQAELPKHGLQARSNLLRVLPRRSITNARWDRQEATRGEIVKLLADSAGFEDGSDAKLSIYEHDADGSHDFVTGFHAEIQGSKIEADWAFLYVDETKEIPTHQESPKGYRNPQYFFRVRAGGIETESGLIVFKDWIKVRLLDADGKPMPNEAYVITLADGSEIRGQLDAHGAARVEQRVPGPYRVEFPDANREP